MLSIRVDQDYPEQTNIIFLLTHLCVRESFIIRFLEHVNLLLLVTVGWAFTDFGSSQHCLMLDGERLVVAQGHKRKTVNVIGSGFDAHSRKLNI